MEVVFQEDDEEEVEHKTFNRIVTTHHYDIQGAGLPIIFSVSNLQLYQKLQSTSRHVYLEFFVRYPNQDRFLYAKSPTTHIPPQVMSSEDSQYKKKKDKLVEDDEKDRKDKDGKPEALCSMKFDLKNVKLKVPKVPHQIFGRLMAKDDYFPTAVGTFDFKVDRTFLQDKRNMDAALKASERGGKDDSKMEPEAIGIPMFSAMKVAQENDPKTGLQEEDKIIQIGQLNIRILGYVEDPDKSEKPRHKKKKKEKTDDDDEDDAGEEDESEEEESDDD